MGANALTLQSQYAQQGLKPSAFITRPVSSSPDLSRYPAADRREGPLQYDSQSNGDLMDQLPGTLRMVKMYG